MTSEQAALLQKARDSLQAARLLLERQFYDFAASRAYYAMFYVAQAFLLNEDLSFSKHSAVIAAFGQRFAKTGKVPPEYHRHLIQGQAVRNVGDYDIGSAISEANAVEQVVHAEAFIGLAEQLLGSAPHSDIESQV
jgi:uncharacterized protein (UPF0332 family)